MGANVGHIPPVPAALKSDFSTSVHPGITLGALQNTSPWVLPTEILI